MAFSRTFVSGAANTESLFHSVLSKEVKQWPTSLWWTYLCFPLFLYLNLWRLAYLSFSFVCSWIFLHNVAFSQLRPGCDLSTLEISAIMLCLWFSCQLYKTHIRLWYPSNHPIRCLTLGDLGPQLLSPSHYGGGRCLLPLLILL